MRKIYLILTFGFVFGCIDKKAENISKMETNLKTFLIDFAFKDNSTIIIYEFKSVGYDTSNENYIDTLKMSAANQNFEKYKKLFELSIKMAKLKDQEVRLEAPLGDRTITEIGKDELQKSMEEAKSYRDSMTKYNKLDSVIDARMKKRMNPELIYRARFYIKATSTKDGKDNNMLDTMNVNFDRNLDVIQLTE